MIYIGGGIGVLEGFKVIIVILGLWYIYRMLEVVEGLLINVGFIGKG